MKLKDEFRLLKEQNEYHKKDITERIYDFTSDPSRSAFNSKYGTFLYEDLIPSSLKCERDLDLSYLINERAEKNGNDEVLKLLSRVIRRKISVDNLPAKLALTSVELLLIGAHISDNQNTKNVLKNKAKNLLGMSQSLTEERRLQGHSQEIFKLNERLILQLPERFKDIELASILNDRVNNILSNPESKQLDLFSKLFDKISSVINDPEQEVEQEDFDVLHYYLNLVSGKLDGLENTGK